MITPGNEEVATGIVVGVPESSESGLNFLIMISGSNRVLNQSVKIPHASSFLYFLLSADSIMS